MTRQFLQLKTAVLIGTLCLTAAQVTAQTAAPLIPRRDFFSEPDKFAIRLSPDGTQVSYLAPVNGVTNIWAGPLAKPDTAAPLTRLTDAPVLNYQWAYTLQQIVYLSRVGQGVHLLVLDLRSGQTRDLTPQAGVAARIEKLSPDVPNEVLISLNSGDRPYSDIHRVNLSTGEMKLVQKNDGYDSFFYDDQFQPRVARRNTANGGYELFKRTADGSWAQFDKLTYEEARVTQPVTLDKRGQVLYLIDNRHTDTGVLKSVNLQTGKTRTLVRDPLADVIPFLMTHPKTSVVRSATSAYARTRRHILDQTIARDLKYLRGVHSGDIGIAGQSLDDRKWLIVFQDGGPPRYYAYDRPARRAWFLFTDNRAIEKYQLARRQAVVIAGRDGLRLPGDLYLPSWTKPGAGQTLERPLPLLIYVHGGPSVAYPWNSWLTNRVLQLLANRGYAVLRVSFRGADGLGKRILKAGGREWGGKMHADVLDAVDWAIAQGVAERNRVGIFGWSYGGYETIMALALNPDRFACGVGMYSVTDLVEMMETRNPLYFRQFWRRQVGDESTEEGRALLRSRSPVTHAEKITKPLLLTHGGKDQAVAHTHSDKLVAALKKHERPVTYLFYPNEMHDYRQAASWISFFAVAERFLHEHLGGRYEVAGDDLAGAGFEVVAGANLIPELSKETQ
jgi:dipeptidyl aminopeptidase/acylaminoacyl peptidase